MMNLTKPINGIFFDIGGTLNYDATGYWMFPKKSESLINLDGIYYVPIKRFNTAYTKCSNYLKKDLPVNTMEEEYERYITFYTMLADYIPEFELTKEKIKLIAHDKVYNVENDIFFDDVPQALKTLSEKYKLGLISDSWPSCEYKLKSADLYGYFTAVSFSCHLGVYKPDARMFEHALDQMGFPANETILIDDARENLEAARAFGIQPVWLNTKSDNKDNSFLTINSISEILQYL